MSLRLKMAPTGNLTEFVAAQKAALAKAGTNTMRRVGDGAKGDWRGQIEGAGLGKLGKAIKAKVYPEGTDTIRAAAQVYVQPKRAPLVIRAFSEGEIITTRNGRFLAIPTENAPKRGIGGGRISPKTWPVDRYGPLRLVKRQNGPWLLVVDDLRGSYRNTGELRGFIKARSARAARVTVVMFFLVPATRLKKLLDVASIQQKWGQAIPSILTEELQKAEDSLGRFK